MADQASLRARVVALVLPAAGTDNDDIDAALTAAFVTLDRWEPRRVEVAATLSDGGYDLTTLASWTAGFSVLSQIEYPLAEFPVEYLPRTDWRVSTADALTVYNGGGISVQFGYTAQNTVATLSDALAETLALLGAADLMESWAAKWVQKESVSVAGEDYEGPSSDNARRLAAELRTRARKTSKTVVFLAGTDLA